MLQKSQIGIYRKKDSVLQAKVGKIFISPQNREYIIDYEKIGRKYIFKITYKGNTMQVLEAVYNNTNIDSLLDAIEKEIVLHKL